MICEWSGLTFLGFCFIVSSCFFVVLSLLCLLLLCLVARLARVLHELYDLPLLCDVDKSEDDADDVRNKGEKVTQTSSARIGPN